MKQITEAEFKTAIGLDPGWAIALTEPVEITEFCDMQDSPITHLSPLLHFTGRNKWGEAAIFINCKALKIAEGTFGGFVNFDNSGITRIGKLTITHPDDQNCAASFKNCKNLSVAEGTFPGFVIFQNSGVRTARELKINSPGWKADFAGCNLRLTGDMLGSEYQMDERVRQQNLARIAAGKAAKQAQQQTPALEI